MFRDLETRMRGKLNYKMSELSQVKFHKHSTSFITLNEITNKIKYIPTTP